MANDEGTTPDLARTVSEWSEDLIGFEPTTAAFDPHDAGDSKQLAGAILDARRAGVEILIVKSSEGRLTVWTRATLFWSP